MGPPLDNHYSRFEQKLLLMKVNYEIDYPMLST